MVKLLILLSAQIGLDAGCIWGTAWHPPDSEEHKRGPAPDPGLCRCQLCGCSHPGVEEPAWRSGNLHSSYAWPAHLTNQACDVQIEQLILAIAERHGNFTVLTWMLTNLTAQVALPSGCSALPQLKPHLKPPLKSGSSYLEN